MNISQKSFPFKIPDWVLWLAQDSSGIWWGYSVEPLRNDSGWYENEVGEYIKLGSTSPDNWQNSLTQIKHRNISR
jgi:hypothetical protein